jgi:hypothetical protein
MSYPLLTLPKGVTWNYKRSPKFNNIVQQPQSGRHPASWSLQFGTLFEFELTWNYLKQNGVTTTNDIQYLQEFYEAMGGGLNWFVFDPSQNLFENLSVTNNLTQLQNGFSGQAVSGQLSYPLWRSTTATNGSTLTLLERIQNVSLFDGLYLNGALVPSSSYSLTMFPATVTFNAQPTVGSNIAWQGNYNYLVRFAEDTIDFNEFMFQLWDLKSLKMESINL